MAKAFWAAINIRHTCITILHINQLLLFLYTIMAHIYLLFCLISMAAMTNTKQIMAQVTYTVTNEVANTPGGSRFTTDIGEDYTKQIMDSSTNFIWTTLNEGNPADRKDLKQVDLFIDDTESAGIIAYTSNNQIRVSARSIQGDSGDVKTGFTGVVYHEMTHVWQWNGNGNANSGLIEGIADYIRLKAGYPSSGWVQPGQGDRWDQGYDVTAYFLDYCNSRLNCFVAELNKKMRDGYSDSYFIDLLGESVDQLWADYKAKYNT